MGYQLSFLDHLLCNSHIFGLLSPDSRPIVAGNTHNATLRTYKYKTTCTCTCRNTIGSLAGLSMIFLPSGSRKAIMLFFFVRALELLACHGVERGMIMSPPSDDEP
jgi:hypothetical protein